MRFIPFTKEEIRVYSGLLPQIRKKCKEILQPDFNMCKLEYKEAIKFLYSPPFIELSKTYPSTLDPKKNYIYQIFQLDPSYLTPYVPIIFKGIAILKR